MITDVINNDVFQTPYKNIAYAINTEGLNDSGFAGQVSQRVPQLANTGDNKLGTVISAEANGKKFHALVCHLLSDGGWNKAPEAISVCLKRIDAPEIDAPEDEPIAIVLMGAGMIGQLSGADVIANLKAIHASPRKFVLYCFEYSKNAVAKALGAKGKKLLA